MNALKHNICPNQNFIISLHQPKLKLFQFKLVLEQTKCQTKPVENQMIKQNSPGGCHLGLSLQRCAWPGRPPEALGRLLARAQLQP